MAAQHIIANIMRLGIASDALGEQPRKYARGLSLSAIFNVE